MESVPFDMQNTVFGPPTGFTEGQIATIPAHLGEIPGPHALEGSKFVVVAWKPSHEDLQCLINGGVIYLTMVGGLAPHFLTTRVEEACYQS